MPRSATRLLKGTIIVVFAAMFFAPSAAVPVITTDAAWQTSVWGGATFGRGQWTQGFARAVAGTLDNEYASRSERTHLNPGTTVTGWGSYDITALAFRGRAQGNSTVTFDPGATGERGADSTATIRDFEISYGVITRAVRAEIDGDLTTSVRCPLDGSPTSVTAPAGASLVLRGTTNHTIAIPPPNGFTSIDVSGLGFRLRGTLWHNRTVTDRTAKSELVLDLDETQVAILPVWEITTTLVRAECSTTPDLRDMDIHDKLVAREPDDEPDCRPYLLGIGGDGQRDAEQQGRPTFIGNVLKRYQETARTESLDYPSSVWPLGPYTKDESVSVGTESAIDAIDDYREQCSEGKVVIVAHSLGAEIAGNIADHADHVVLFGDPRAPGGIYSAFTGIFPGLSGPGPRTLGPNTVSVCNEYSLICDAPAPWIDPIHFGLSVQGYLFGRHNYDYNVDAALGQPPGHYYYQRRNPNPVLPEHTPDVLPKPPPGFRFPFPFQLPPWQPGPLPHLGTPRPPR